MKERRLSLTHWKKRKRSERRRLRKGRKSEPERGTRKKRKDGQLNVLLIGVVGGEKEKGRRPPWIGVQEEKKEEKKGGVRQNDLEALGSLQLEVAGGTGRRRKKASGIGKRMRGRRLGGKMIDRLPDEMMIDRLPGVMMIDRLREGMMILREGEKVLEDGDEGMPLRKKTMDLPGGTLEDEMPRQEEMTDREEILEPLEEGTWEKAGMIVVPGGTSEATRIVDPEETSEGTETQIAHPEETSEGTETLLREEILVERKIAALEGMPLMKVPPTGEGTAPLPQLERRGNVLLLAEKMPEIKAVEAGGLDLRKTKLHHHQNVKNPDPLQNKKNLSLNHLVKMFRMMAGRLWPPSVKVGSNQKFLDVLVSNTERFFYI